MTRLLCALLLLVTLAACAPEPSHTPGIGQWQAVVDQGWVQ